MKTRIKICLIFLTGFLFLNSISSAQEYTEEQLQKIIQNPLAYLNFLPIQNNTYFGLGYNADRTLNELNIQPVLPFKLGKNVNVITRTIFPVITAPTDENSSVTGLGDITLDMFFTPANPGKFIEQRDILNWFYERSPYIDSVKNVYPIGRIFDEEQLRTLISN